MRVTESKLRSILRDTINEMSSVVGDPYFTDPLTPVEDDVLRTAVDLIEPGIKGGNIVYPWMVSGILGISEKVAYNALLRLSKIGAAYDGKKIVYRFGLPDDEITFIIKKA